MKVARKDKSAENKEAMEEKVNGTNLQSQSGGPGRSTSLQPH